MSIPNQQQPTPAGWYADPDPQNSGGQRWWDGARWTEHSRPAPSAPVMPQQQPHIPATSYGQPGYPGQVVYPKVAPGTPSLTLHIWFVVGLPLLTSIALMFVDFTGYLKAVISLSDSGSLSSGGYNSQFGSAISTFGASVLIVDVLGFVVYGLSVMFAYFDYRALAQRGYARPFHWAWTFLSGIVYVIGRTVVVRRRGGSEAMWPVWGLIAVYAIGLALGIIKFVLVANAVGDALSPYISNS